MLTPYLRPPNACSSYDSTPVLTTPVNFTSYHTKSHPIPSHHIISHHDSNSNPFDGAVEVEVVIEAILVIGDGADEGDDEAAIPAHLRNGRAPVGVLPGHAAVLLVHADLPAGHVKGTQLGDGEWIRCYRVLNHGSVAGVTHDISVEVVDDANAVAPEHQRVRIAAETVLAGVEGILQTMRTSRVAYSQPRQERIVEERKGKERKGGWRHLP